MSATTATTLYLVRHGESVANVTREFSYRRVDPPLTASGLAQVRATADHLRTLPIDALYTSPMLRAIQTAEVFGEALALGYEIVEELREVNVGVLEDQPPNDEAWALHRQILDDWSHGRFDSGFPGGEDYHGLSGRALRALNQIIGARRGRSLVIVGHGAIFSAMVHALCPVVDDAERLFRGSANCSITTVTVRHDDSGLIGGLVIWGSREHLP